MRGRITYANVVATLALVLAMGGGAYAAKRYLINSTKQINPKVLRTLRGARGPRGYAGATGAIGPQGATGVEGKRGPRGAEGEAGFSALSQLPSGRSESGDWALQGTAAAEHDKIVTAISFPVPLAAPIPAANVEFTPVSVPTKNCAGRGTAARGYLCVYMRFPPTNLLTEVPAVVEDPEVPAGEHASAGTGTFGAILSWEAAAAGLTRLTGTFTVTAP